ncbi:hypothetical protein [Paracoccus aestuariivivens]|uniref:Uncharacterized protein n=1 Tax=Paracoccus aestuariivivens TaxID=1820333 RepID=A0A6L6JHI5_9RHOB|nr:hypothetical protein [Paracoccus aestuariivivens]MTH79341.1 hypothetical protein [Paracoccus aestuariivivens]
MAKTPAESQREYRKRVKQRKAEANLEASSVFRKPFFEYFNEQELSDSEFDFCLGNAGFQTPEFPDDRGPEHYMIDPERDAHGQPMNPFYAERSVGRAEVIIGSLIDAANDLAHHVNDYKRTEIKARLAEIEASDLSDPAKKNAALTEAIRLNKMLDQLDKQVRRAFTQWRVTG